MATETWETVLCDQCHAVATGITLNEDHTTITQAWCPTHQPTT